MGRSQFHGGWLPDRPDRRDLLLKVEVTVKLPKKIDLRGKCPPVYDQGALGSCTANAIAAAIQFDRIRQKLDVWTPSRLQIYYNERVMINTVNEDSGAFIRDGIKSVNKVGAGRETLWPYNIWRFTEPPSAEVVDDGNLHPSVRYQRVDNSKLRSMKYCLAHHGPFVIGFTVYASFMSIGATGDVPMPQSNEGVVGGHAILIVGYDDTVERFMFQNSWGSGWGVAGYGTFPYAYLTDWSLADDAWTITLVK